MASPEDPKGGIIDRSILTREDVMSHKEMVRGILGGFNRRSFSSREALLENNDTLYSHTKVDFIYDQDNDGVDSYFTVLTFGGNVEDEYTEYSKIVVRAVDRPKGREKVKSKISENLLVYRFVPVKKPEIPKTKPLGNVDDSFTEGSPSKTSFDKLIGIKIFDLLASLIQVDPVLMEEVDLYNLEHFNEREILGIDVEKFNKLPIQIATKEFLKRLFYLIGPIKSEGK